MKLSLITCPIPFIHQDLVPLSRPRPGSSLLSSVYLIYFLTLLPMMRKSLRKLHIPHEHSSLSLLLISNDLHLVDYFAVFIKEVIIVILCDDCIVSLKRRPKMRFSNPSILPFPVPAIKPDLDFLTSVELL